MGLKKAEMQIAFLKAGLYGLQGSGKTFTAGKIALALHKYLGLKKPVAFIDSETGIDFIIPMFKKAGIELLEERSRSFITLMDTLKQCNEGAASILIIDSITHFWLDLVKAYKDKKQRDYVSLPDWEPLKAEFSKFSELYLTSKLHVIICGRSGNVYENERNERGKMESYKVDTKMKAETEIGYEPSLLIEMERGLDKDGKTIRTATVLKDRADLLDGKSFINPTFEDFLPHILFINPEGKHNVLDVNSDSAILFSAPDWSSYDRKRQSEIIMEKIENEFIKADISTKSDFGKKVIIELLEKSFNSNSWAEIQNKKIEDLKTGFIYLRELIKIRKGIKE
jgi:hypothetical protein